MMTRPVRPEILEQVTAALGETGQPPRTINATLPDLTRSAICAALLALVRCGRAARDGETDRYRYRRLAGRT
jgi:hypothetical protein